MAQQDIILTHEGLKELQEKLDASRKAASEKVLEKNKAIEDKFNN